MNDTLARKIQLLDRLRSGVGCTVDLLAQELAVSRRTIFRDLKALSRAGLRIDVKNSQYRLVGQVGPPPARIELRELQALVFAAHLSPLMTDSQFGVELRQAMRKLIDNADPADRNETADLLLACSVHHPAAGENAIPPQGRPGVLRALLPALAGNRGIQIVFADGGKPIHTRLAPERLTVTEGRWVVEGYSSYHRRHYSLDLNQINSVALTESPAQEGSIPPPHNQALR